MNGPILAAGLLHLEHSCRTMVWLMVSSGTMYCGPQSKLLSHPTLAGDNMVPFRMTVLGSMGIVSCVHGVALADA